MLLLVWGIVIIFFSKQKAIKENMDVLLLYIENI